MRYAEGTIQRVVLTRRNISNENIEYLMSKIACPGCDNEVDEGETTSISEFYGISTAISETKFCEKCMKKIESKSDPSFML